MILLLTVQWFSYSRSLSVAPRHFMEINVPEGITVIQCIWSLEIAVWNSIIKGKRRVLTFELQNIYQVPVMSHTLPLMISRLMVFSQDRNHSGQCFALFIAPKCIVFPKSYFETCALKSIVISELKYLCWVKLCEERNLHVNLTNDHTETNSSKHLLYIYWRCWII